MRSILPLTIAGALVATPIHAEPRSAIIVVSSSDLGTPAATNRFHRRVAGVIEQICGSYATIESDQVPDVDECSHTAWKTVKARTAELKGRVQIRLSAR